MIPLVPMALSTVVEETVGLRRFQLIQIGPTTLRIRLEALPEADEAQVWMALVNRLRAYLSAQGIAEVALEHASERPVSHPVSGKFRHVWSELPRQEADQQQV